MGEGIFNFLPFFSPFPALGLCLLVSPPYILKEKLISNQCVIISLECSSASKSPFLMMKWYQFHASRKRHATFARYYYVVVLVDTPFFSSLSAVQGSPVQCRPADLFGMNRGTSELLGQCLFRPFFVDRSIETG
jgi:hypothetical protein